MAAGRKELVAWVRDLGWDPRLLRAPEERPGSEGGAIDQPAGDDLDGLAAFAARCRACRLADERTNVVFGVGNPDAELMLIGEAPGSEEDRRGEPFVGQAGQLLDAMIRALGLARADVYIANVVKCRPPKNRNPQSDEMDACAGFLQRQIELVSPQLILALGKVAAQRLLGSERSMGAMRGRWARYEGVDVMATYHPAYLLRSPEAKRLVWDDLKLVRTRLSER